MTCASDCLWLLTQCPGGELFWHINREYNSRADALAKEPKNSVNILLEEEGVMTSALAVRGFWDGSVDEHRSGFGWLVEVAVRAERDDLVWHEFAAGSFSCEDMVTPVVAECLWLISMATFLSCWLIDQLEDLASLSRICRVEPPKSPLKFAVVKGRKRKHDDDDDEQQRSQLQSDVETQPVAGAV